MNNKTIKLSPNEDAFLLEYLKKNVTELKQKKIKSLLEHKQISVNGTFTSKYNYEIKKGDTVEIYLIPIEKKQEPFEIIYEDKYLIAINKPYGLLSVATDKEKNNTAFRILKDIYKKEIYVVHRLDRDTSGVLLFAKRKEIKDKLQDNWDNVLKREYLAVCEGVFVSKKGKIENYLLETKTHIVYSSDRKGSDGKKAITEYEVLKENEEYSLVKVLISTGRKNQIRVHLHDLGHPVVGDKKYGAKTNPLKRLGLHASELVIIHPVTNEPLKLRAKRSRHFTLPYIK